MSIMGRLGADPQIKETRNGIPYVQFRLANNAFGDPEGTTYWFTVTVWDGRCMNMAKKLKKGSLVEVDGDYSDRVYTNNNTGKMEIGRDLSATAIYFAGAPKDENNPNSMRTEPPATDAVPTESRSHTPAAQPQAPMGEPVSNTAAKPEEDLPF